MGRLIPNDCWRRNAFVIQPLTGLIIASFFFFSCTESVSKIETEAATNGLEYTTIAEKVASDNPLSIPEYIQWLKAQKGVTYAQGENEQAKVSILYKPLALEAAMSASAETSANAGLYEEYLKIKKGYHHLLLEYLEKTATSVGTSPKNARSLADIQQSLIIIKNNSDTIHHPIIEVFPSRLLQQPHQILLIVPHDSIDNRLKVKVKGKVLGLDDFGIEISNKQLKSFPEIKR